MSHQILARLAMAAACGTFVLQAACTSKVDECNKVIDVVNQTVTDMTPIEAQMNTEDPAAVAAGADKALAIANGAVAKLSATELKTPEVQKFSVDYQKLVKDLAAVYSVAKGQMELVTGHVKSLEAAGKKVEESMSKFTATCTSDATAAEECGKLGAIMEKFPDDPAADVAGLKAAIGELKAAVVANAALKPVVADIAASFEGMIGAIEGLNAVQAVIEANGKKAEALSASESTLVDGFNAFCQAP